MLRYLQVSDLKCLRKSVCNIGVLKKGENQFLEYGFNLAVGGFLGVVFWFLFTNEVYVYNKD